MANRLATTVYLTAALACTPFGLETGERGTSNRDRGGELLVSAAISLGNTLYYDYGWYFRGAALLLAGIGVYIHLKKRNACSLQGAKSNRRMIAVVSISMVVVYLGFLFFTTWLEQISASPPSLP